MSAPDTIAPILLDRFPKINAEQKRVIAHVDGPLLVIAGPGSGKTFSLVLRAINLLLTERAKPSELMLCTFTEKAAYELQDRIGSAARAVNYKGDLSELRVGTIHGICNKLILEFRHLTPLGSGYETLDDLTQLLFIFDHFREIFGATAEPPYLGHWKTKWTAIEGIRDYLNKITEELVSPQDMAASGNEFISGLATAYLSYRKLLFDQNRVDFAHQQKMVFELLQDPEVCAKITGRVRYVLVDEYQDTNYIQEQILFALTRQTKNLCVVGDEDQAPLPKV